MFEHRLCKPHHVLGQGHCFSLAAGQRFRRTGLGPESMCEESWNPWLGRGLRAAGSSGGGAEGWAGGQGAELGAASTQPLSISCCGHKCSPTESPGAAEGGHGGLCYAVLWAWMFSLPLGPLVVCLLLLVQHGGGGE